MPKQVGRPKKETPIDKQEEPINNHAKFCGDQPCRITLHWNKADFEPDEVQCKSYSFTHGVLYLATKTGEQVIPASNIRKFEVNWV